jgi:LPXTG-motif cell wall-anchored protein
MKPRSNFLVLITLLSLLLLLLGAGSVLAQGEDRVEFTNISDGDTISQLTVLMGTITFPDLLKYEIFLKSGNNLVWVGNSHGRVIEGNLVRLDPRVFTSGTYQLVVRKVNSNSNYTDEPGPTITIENPNGLPLPYYPEIEPSFLYPSELVAVVRVRNCSGEDFNFDFISVSGTGNSGDTKLPGKPEGEFVCVFEDMAWRPDHYRGTGQGGGQSESAPIELIVDEWHVYEIIYFGGRTLNVGEVGPDEGQGAVMGGQPVAASTPKPIPTPTPKAAEPQAQVAPPTPMPGQGKTETVLPTTGNETDLNLLTIAIAFGAVLLLGGAGFIAIRKRQYN